MGGDSAPRYARGAWDRDELPGRFSVEETARRVGNYKWVEMKMFELMGGWVASVPELDIKLVLGTHCYHHAFHADLWHKRLPELREMNPARLTVPANAEVEAFFTMLADPELSSDTLTKLVGLYRVLLPQVISAYTFHRNNAASITDAPTIRALEFCLRDDAEEWRDGEMMVQSLLDSPEAIERAAAHQARLECQILVCGGIAGAGTTSSFGLSSFGPTSSVDSPG